MPNRKKLKGITVKHDIAWLLQSSGDNGKTWGCTGDRMGWYRRDMKITLRFARLNASFGVKYRLWKYKAVK